MKALRAKIREWLKRYLKRDRSGCNDLNLEKWAALEYSRYSPLGRKNINFKHLIERK